METRPTIIPIASGKGGVGKTFITANLAIALAEMGYSTVAVDMDLGGSNLYSFLGLPNRFPGIGDFLKARSNELENMLVPTEITNLKFLAGEGRTPFLANMPHAQKLRLISRIKKLPAMYVLLDLGAGTSFNTLDYFRLSTHGIVITIPEYPSIISILAFLKHFLLRAIERTFANDSQIRNYMHSLYKRPMTDEQVTINTLHSEITAIDHKAGKILMELCHKYRPRIVFNMGEHPDDLKIARQINDSLGNILSIEADYFGFIFQDSSVRQSIKKQTTFLNRYHESIAAESLKRIAERIVKYLDKPVKNSAQLLFDHTLKLYKTRNISND